MGTDTTVQADCLQVPEANSVCGDPTEEYGPALILEHRSLATINNLHDC